MKASVGMLGAIAAVVVLALFSVVVVGAPTGAEGIGLGSGERSDRGAGTITVQAEGGNTTSLSVNATQITGRWQGYYGNISGTIVLDDANNDTLYSWDLTAPSGEIFASNGSGVNWADIDCINATAIANGSSAAAGQRVYSINLSHVNDLIGYSTDTLAAASDSVNATFNMTYGDPGTGTDSENFDVGNVNFDNADNCSLANMYNDAGWQSTSFHEVLMTDNLSIIFTALIETDVTGFQAHPVDFQMIVGVNQSNTRNYFFYVELT